ncbi:hypothetical protein [Haloactinopolyspora sp.]|uniref:hypothetical protein n=1 Tax=Haloactinopolyspora sp. TaxID=1966353 RepID=UPI00260D17E4|nr:hypothetical protein [Haloactinopolyspora sp.]
MTSTRINRRTLLGGAAGLGAAAVGAGWITTSARARAAAELPNPGFEELTDGWPTRWRAFNDASRANITIVTDPVHGGANALRIDDDTATGIGVRSAEVPVEEGTFYEGSIFALVETGSFVLYLEFWNAAGTRITTATRTFGDVAGWQQIRIRAQAPSGAVAATVLPYSAQNNTGSAVFDDAGIATVEVTEPELFGTAALTGAVRGGTRIGDTIYFTSRHPVNQGAARLGAVDFRTGQLEYTVDLDLGNASAGNMMCTDGTHVYIGSSGSRYIWRYTPGADSAEALVDLGASRWVYSMSVHGEHLYFGTYNDGTVRRARLSDGVIDVVYGRVSTSMYATGAAADDDYVYGGSSAPGRLLRWPKEGGDPVDLSGHLSDSPVGILDMLVTGGKIYVACGRQVISMNPDGSDRVSRDILEDDRYVDKLTVAADGSVYAIARLTTNVYRVTETGLDHVAQPFDHVENQFLGVADDNTIVGVTGLGQVWWIPPGGEATVFDAAETEFGYPDETQSMLRRRNGDIWVGGHFAMTVHRLSSGQVDRFFVNGEPKAMVEGSDGTVYAAMYPSAQVLAIHPRTFEVTLLGKIEGQMRTMDMNIDHKRNVLMIGTGPSSGRYDGALTFVDLDTGAFETRKDILPDHRVHGIAHDDTTAYVVGDTVGEGNSQPLLPVAEVAAVDLDTREVLWRRVLKEDWLSYEDVLLDGNLLYFMGRRPNGGWFAYDLKTEQIVREGDLGGYGAFGSAKGAIYAWVHFALEITELPSRVSETGQTLYSPVPNGWYNNPFFNITANGKHTWGMWGSQLARFDLPGPGRRR